MFSLSSEIIIKPFKPNAMKAIKFIIWVSLLALLSCQPSEKESVIIEEDKLFPVEFSLTLKEEIMPFPGTRSIPSLDIPEPTAQTKGDEEEKELQELCCSIEYIVFKDGEDTPCRNITFTKEDLDFGIISDQFQQGEYNIYIIAHNSPDAEISGTTLKFDEISDTFYYFHYLEVMPENDHSETITLYRVVSKIEFVSTDKVPENAKEFTIQLENYPYQLDLITGHGIIPEEPSPIFTYSLTEHIGETGLTHAFFSFVTEEETDITAELKTIDTSDEILRERTVTGITPITNHIIRYKGRLYTPSHSDDEFTITIDENGQWAGTNEEELGD